MSFVVVGFALSMPRALVPILHTILFTILVPGTVAYAALMLSAAHVFVVLYEEPTLRRQFGDSYAQYLRTVPRWIPKFRARD